MDEDTFFEIDEPADWVIIEKLMQKQDAKREEIPEIKMFLTDCDGCLTDAGMYYSEKGDELKKFNTRDGMGISLLRQSGIITGIITSEDVAIVRNRAKKLCMEEVHCGIKNKLETVKEICGRRGIALENVAYVGDDINDLEVIRAVGFGCSVINGAEEVKAAAKYVSPVAGGSGAIRNIADKILGR